MAKARPMRTKIDELFKALRPFMKRAASGRLGKHELFLLCVKASLVNLPSGEREELIHLLMDHDVHARIKTQEVFFGAVRPHQSVLRVKNVNAHIAVVEQGEP